MSAEAHNRHILRGATDCFHGCEPWKHRDTDAEAGVQECVRARKRVEAGEEAARSVTGLSGTHEVMRVDLADLQSVREFVAAFTAEHDRLDGLACNAGMVNMRGDLERTKDGFESTRAVSCAAPSS